MNEKSTTRQFLTVGLSSSKSMEYLKIQFKDMQTDKVESLILDSDYSLETVCKNLDPILVTPINNVKSQSDEKSSNISNVGTKNRVPVLGVLKSNNLS
jgi:hypothetical protein